MLLTNVSASSINDAALALADVIYFNYVSNGDLRIDLSPVGRWLKASAKRVLILSFDSQGVILLSCRNFSEVPGFDANFTEKRFISVGRKVGF